MNKNQKSFRIFLLLAAAAIIIAAVGFIGWQAIYKRAQANSQDSATMPVSTSNLEVGVHSIDLKTSDKILLPSGAILSLPERDVDSVPVFNYGSASNKSLAIRTQLELYHNSYRYKVTKGACRTATKTFSDYTATIVTDCTVSIDIQKANQAALSPAQVTKRYIVTGRDSRQAGSPMVLGTNPFLMVGGGNGRVTYPINNGKPYLEGNDGDSVSLEIVTDYGTTTISYNVDELLARTEKRVSVAGSEVRVTPRVTCTAPYLEDGKCPVVNDMFVFDFIYTRQPVDNSEIVIYDLR